MRSREMVAAVFVLVTLWTAGAAADPVPPGTALAPAAGPPSPPAAEAPVTSDTTVPPAPSTAPVAPAEPSPPPAATPSASGAATASAAPATAPDPNAAPAAAAPPVAPAPPTTAWVRLYASRPGAWLELRDTLAQDAWVRACDAPCNASIVVEGTDARINGPGITPSNPFRIEPGAGAARLRVKAGSLQSRRLGTLLLATGLPAAAGGFALYGFGNMGDEPSLQVSGLALITVGAAAALTAFPLISRGGTRVRDERGHRIAGPAAAPRF